MLDLGFVFLLTGWSAGVGLSILRRLGPLPSHPVDALALAVPLGLGTLALAALGLAEFGLLGREYLMIVLAIAAICTFCPSGVSLLRRRGQVHQAEGPGGGRRGQDALGLAFDLALIVTLLGTLLTALAPVTDGDALCYHLQVPKVFLANRAALFDPDLHETVYPLATEMLYAVALAFRGPVACRLLQWVLGLTFAANVTAIARPVLGARARWAGTIALLVPAISNGMGAPLNDVALAAFGLATLAAWLGWLARPTPGAAILAGAMAGLTLGVKYPALVWTGVLGIGMVCVAPNRWRGWDQRRVSSWQSSDPASRDLDSRIWHLPAQVPTLFRHAMLFGLMAILVGGGWYLRAFIHTGNPVYPFFRQTFGGAGIDEVLDPVKRPLAATPGNLLTALAPMTLQPDRFDSLSHQFGPAFLLFLPPLLVWKPPRRVWGLMALGFLFLTICLTRRQSMRFVLIAVGPWSVAVAWLAQTWWERRGLARRALVGAIVVLLGFEATLALARARHGLPVLLGRETSESYLARREPTYRVGRWVAKHLPSTARLVGQDHRGFYLPRPYTMELAHRRRTGLGTRGESPERIVEHLRRQGFTHLLLCPPQPETAVEFDPTLGRLLAPWLASRRPLYDEEIADADRVVRRYAIFDLWDTGVRLAREETLP